MKLPPHELLAMSKTNHPSPPQSDNPIVILRAMSANKEHNFLKELLAANSNGDVDRAAKCATAALASTLKRDMVNAMVNIVNNLAYEKQQYPESIKLMLCKAADSGFHEYAYNAANHVMAQAGSTANYRVAERYFKMAMNFTEKPALQAAAYVNYCPLIRDGLISGAPDWPAAVELYEKAARMGLVKAMFNAGNVSSWLAAEGHRDYGARAAHWFRHALEVQATGMTSLDMESPAELAEVYAQSMTALSALHIDAKFDGAQLEEGIRWAKAAINQGNREARQNLGVAYIRRLTKLNASPEASPGANWRSVLTQMDWQFQDPLRKLTLRVALGTQSGVPVHLDALTVALADGTTAPLFVTHDACLPALGGLERLTSIAVHLAERYPAGYFLLNRRAIFMQKGEASYTPIYVWHQGKFSRQALWMGSSPEVVQQHAAEGVDFLDERFGTWTCMIPIAVNVLDEGFVVAKDAEFGLPWVGVGGGWRMPFLDEAQLSKVGIAPRKS